jgi:hypothetical protein
VKKLFIIVGIALLGGMLTACSSDDEEYKGNEVAYIPNPNCEEQYTTSEENGLSITRDESGRVRYIVVFRPDQDGVEKLLNAPTSFDDIRYLFPLSEGNEIKIEDEGDTKEKYIQYYKGIPVMSGSIIKYFVTMQGRRISEADIHFFDVKDLDPNPDLSKDDALQVFANYIKVPRQTDWTCYLFVNEYSKRSDSQIIRDHRLIYTVYGRLPNFGYDKVYEVEPLYEAEIDAHTGEILRFTASYIM